MNPPFSIMARVIEKLKADAGHAILTMPAWHDQQWYKDAQELIKFKIIYPRGSNVFRDVNHNVLATMWDTEVCLICGHSPQCTVLHHHLSKARKRKDRRRRTQEKLKM